MKERQATTWNGLVMLLLLLGALGGSVVAVDAVGAGEGEYVLYASGSSARQTAVTDKRPVDAVVMAIVDSWDIEGDEKYRKGDG